MTTRPKRPQTNHHAGHPADWRRSFTDTETLSGRCEAIRIALSMGVSLGEIERFLDYLDTSTRQQGRRDEREMY